jgi:hypothetical protein
MLYYTEKNYLHFIRVEWHDVTTRSATLHMLRSENLKF